jgi:cell division septation protein DedD
MAKKIFVTRNTEKPGRPPYVKLLLWAAVGLVVLIIVAPLFTQKGNKGAQRGADKNGVVVREIPRTGLPPGDVAPQLPGQLPDVGRTGESRVMPIPPEIKGFTDAPPKSPPPETTAGDKTPPGEGTVRPEGGQGMVPVLPGAAPPREVAGVPPEAGAPRAKPEAPSAKPAEVHESALPKPKEAAPTPPGSKPAAEEPKVKPSADKTLYTVQVGSFQEKRYADEMQQNLQKRGYKTVVKIKNHPKLGQVHVVQLEPVVGIDKANTLVAQIRHEQKVNPIIQKVQPGE